MKNIGPVIAISFLSLFAGCGDPCDEAGEKLEGCESASREPVTELECTGQDECLAQCFIDHGSCEDLDKPVEETSPAYRDCQLGCLSK
jgi:hypothetical protein